MFGPHIDMCPFNENDPATIDSVIANLRQCESGEDDGDNEDNDDYQDAVENPNERVFASTSFETGKKAIKRGLKRRLEEIKNLDPNDTTPEFSDTENEGDTQLSHSPVFKTSKVDRMPKEASAHGDEAPGSGGDHDDGDANSDNEYDDIPDFEDEDAEFIESIRRPLNSSLDSISISSHESDVYADRKPVHGDHASLDFRENVGCNSDEETPDQFQRVSAACMLYIICYHKIVFHFRCQSATLFKSY